MPDNHPALPETQGTQDRMAPDQILTDKQMRELQKSNIIAALDAKNWKVSGKDGTAELLGVRPTTLYDRLKAFGIKKPRG